MQWADNVGETMVPGALIPFLQRAIDRKFLNPLSVEADQNLAFDVFEASDAVFCSLWLPRDVVQSSGKVPELGYDVLWVPFPSPGRQGIVPRVRFRLWAAPPFSLTVERLVGLSPPSSSPLPNVRACSFQDDMSWMKDFGPRMYDLLIMGDL